MESWFYTLVELTKGALPWRLKTGKSLVRIIQRIYFLLDRETVHLSKVRRTPVPATPYSLCYFQLSSRTDTRSTFLEKCPKEYDDILKYIDSLTFVDRPNYDEKICGVLEGVIILLVLTVWSPFFQIITANSYSWDQLFDWEKIDRDTGETTVPSSGCHAENAGESLAGK